MPAQHHSRSRRVLALVAIAASALVGQVLTSTGPAHAAGTAAARHCATAAATTTRVGKFGGIQRPEHRAGCALPLARVRVRGTERPYDAGMAPPLTNPGGEPVMATDPTKPLTITPIFWRGTTAQRLPFSTAYQRLILQYLDDMAADSGTSGNIYATLSQYYMKTPTGRAHIINRFRIGQPLLATNKIPTTCTVNGGRIYSDGSRYSTCVADGDIAAEVKGVLAALRLRADLNHLYPIFLPKHVEVCFFRGNPSNQQCTVNYTRSAAFCAYHSYAKTAGTHPVYAAMPYPIYHSATGATCSSEYDAPGAQYPNNVPDGDVVVSSLSHEMSEAITDPHLNAWSDSLGNENGDICSSEYGPFTGPARQKYNQTINGDHYLTQEEFSNKEFLKGKSGCVQDENAPTITSVTSSNGTVTIAGTGFWLRPGKTTVQFDSAPAVPAVVTSARSLTVPATAVPSGVTQVTVTTPNGTSAAFPYTG